jgi:hypothetical protein
LAHGSKWYIVVLEEISRHVISNARRESGKLGDRTPDVDSVEVQRPARRGSLVREVTAGCWAANAAYQPRSLSECRCHMTCSRRETRQLGRDLRETFVTDAKPTRETRVVLAI